MKQRMQNVRTTELCDEDETQNSEKNLFLLLLTWLVPLRQRTLVVGALVHHLEQLGVFVNRRRCSNRRGRRRHRLNFKRVSCR
jgi:hypothetical protein